MPFREQTLTSRREEFARLAGVEGTNFSEPCRRFEVGRRTGYGWRRHVGECRLVRATRGVEDMREPDARTPFGFVCQPEDIANAVVFLVGDTRRYTTSRRITVDGGGF